MDQRDRLFWTVAGESKPQRQGWNTKTPHRKGQTGYRTWHCASVPPIQNSIYISFSCKRKKAFFFFCEALWMFCRSTTLQWINNGRMVIFSPCRQTKGRSTMKSPTFCFQSSFGQICPFERLSFCSQAIVQRFDLSAHWQTDRLRVNTQTVRTLWTVTVRKECVQDPYIWTWKLCIRRSQTDVLRKSHAWLN